MGELFDRHTQPAHDFDSIHAFRDFVAFGCFDLEQYDWEFLSAEEEKLRAYRQAQLSLDRNRQTTHSLERNGERPI